MRNATYFTTSPRSEQISGVAVDIDSAVIVIPVVVSAA